MNILPSIPSGIINLASKSSLIGKGSPLIFVNPNFDHSDRVFGIDLRLTAPQPFGLICFIVSKNDEEIFFGGSTSHPQVLSFDHGFLSKEVK